MMDFDTYTRRILMAHKNAKRPFRFIFSLRYLNETILGPDRININ